MSLVGHNTVKMNIMGPLIIKQKGEKLKPDSDLLLLHLNLLKLQKIIKKKKKREKIKQAFD